MAGFSSAGGETGAGGAGARFALPFTHRCAYVVSRFLLFNNKFSKEGEETLSKSYSSSSGSSRWLRGG